MPPLIFNVPPIDHEAAEFGDRLHTTKDGVQIPWMDVNLWHLMSAYKALRDRIECGEAELDELNTLDAATERLAELKRYIEYRQSIGNIHGI